MTATADLSTSVMNARLADVDPDVADVIATALTQSADLSTQSARVRHLTRQFPPYDGLEDWELHGR